MEIEVRCPACSKAGKIEVSEERLKKASRGLLAVNVSAEMICEHSFIAYIDKNLEIRDAFIADFQIELPDLGEKEVSEAEEEFITDKIDLTIIKLNFSASLLAYLLKSIFLKEDIAILSDQKFLYSHMNNFIDYITSDIKKDIKVEMIPRETYLEEKKAYEDYVVLENNNVIQNKDSILEASELNVERTIIQRFLEEFDEKSSIIILKNEVQRAFTLAETLVEYIENFEGEEIQSKELIDYVEEKRDITVKIPYLNFLLDIVENFFGIDVPRSSEVSNFLGFL